MFEGKKVRLRALCKDDLPRVREIINDPEVARFLSRGFVFPYRAEDEEVWYAGLDANSATQYAYAIESLGDGALIGVCGIMDIHPVHRNAVAGLFLGRPHWGRGCGTDGLDVLLGLCFEELNLHKVKLQVFDFNERAIRCYERLGFAREGVFREEVFRHGAYRDQIQMALLREDWHRPRGGSRREETFEDVTVEDEIEAAIAEVDDDLYDGPPEDVFPDPKAVKKSAAPPHRRKKARGKPWRGGG